MSGKKKVPDIEPTEEIDLASSQAGEVLGSVDNLWSFIQSTEKVIQSGTGSSPSLSGNLNRSLARALKSHGVDLQNLDDAEFDVARSRTDPQGSVADVEEVTSRVLHHVDGDERAELEASLKNLAEKYEAARGDVKAAGKVQHALLEGEGALRASAMRRTLSGS